MLEWILPMENIQSRFSNSIYKKPKLLKIVMKIVNAKMEFKMVKIMLKTKTKNKIS